MRLLGCLFATLVAGSAFAQTPAPAATPTAGTDAAAPAAVPAPKVRFNTTKGAIVVEVYPDKAPKSVENFLQYVKDKHYDGTLFHRVIDNFMIQGGGFTTDLKPKPTRAAVANEANNGLSNLRGTIAMARTGDPNSATSQFFINVADNTRLDYVSSENGYTWGYAVFGKVVEGMEVVDQIKAVETVAQQPLGANVPKEPVVIESAQIVQ
ncbi:MAG TPA: peptidylprolyl isomerase [Xanthomonadales bacterium]|nr:peptidylprolyl isomerase [Xanthomonadales bacterium]